MYGCSLFLYRFNYIFHSICSEDELLRTISSPSPLALLKRTVGIEVSTALHEVNISDGKIELSGYISSPCNSLAIKVEGFMYTM